jgi:DNA replication and repair protein RecF
LFLNRLTLRNFRNLKAQEILFKQNICAFLGDNGQGKTSILEAIFLLSQRFSFRENNSREVVNWDTPESEPCVIEGEITTTDGSKTVTVEIKSGRKTVKLNGNIIKKASDFYGLVKVIEFVPDDLAVVKGEPRLRRNFFDRTISQIDSAYIDELVLFQRALKNRNSLLKSAKKENLSNTEISRLLAAWDDSIAEHGIILTNKRARFVREIEPIFIKYHELLLSLYQNKKEKISLEYQSDFIEGEKIKTKNEVLSIISEQLSKDIALGASSIGSHKDDFDFQVNFKEDENRSARKTASQGQSRTISLALKIAAFELVATKSNETPIIILDDVESELDRSRRNALGELILSLNSQIIITSTELDESLKPALKNGQIFRVEDGLVFT